MKLRIAHAIRSLISASFAALTFSLVYWFAQWLYAPMPHWWAVAMRGVWLIGLAAFAVIGIASAIAHLIITPRPAAEQDAGRRMN